jgi:hypothetical protein
LDLSSVCTTSKWHLVLHRGSHVFFEFTGNIMDIFLESYSSLRSMQGLFGHVFNLLS